MLYATGRVTCKDGYPGFRLYETCSEMLFDLNMQEMEKLHQRELSVVNLIFDNGTIVEKKWPKQLPCVIRGLSIKSQNEYVLLERINNGSVRLINNFYKIVVPYEYFMQCVNFGYVMNCRRTKNGYRSIDSNLIKHDKEFERKIENMYKLFIAKSQMLGLDFRFEYTIENTDVILSAFKGHTDNFKIPSFITVIGSDAFKLADLKSVTLTSSIKIIGLNAFDGVKISNDKFPDSVKLCGYDYELYEAIHSHNFRCNNALMVGEMLK